MKKTSNLIALEEIFRKRYDQILLVENNDNYTYEQIWANADEIKKEWSQKGANVGDSIGFCQTNSASFLVGLLACAIGGFTAHLVNPNQQKKKIDQAFALTGPKIVLSNPQTIYQPAKKTSIRSIEITQDPNGSFCILSTSGSTGEPKGICHSLNGLLGSARSFSKLARMNESTRLYHVLPMYYMAGFLNSFLAPLFGGGTIILGQQFISTSVFDFWDHCTKHNVNTLCLTPTIALALCYAARNIKVAKRAAANLRAIHSTAGVLYSGNRLRFFQTFGKPLQDCYGMTELGGPLTLQTPEDGIKVENCGDIMPELRLSFRTTSSGDREMWIRSPNVMKGYISDHGIELPLDDKGFMATGDIAELASGKLKVTGRIKDVIIKGSENIYPIEIENQVSSMEGIQEIVAVGVPDEFWGEKVIGCVIPESDVDEGKLLQKLEAFSNKHFSSIFRPDKWLVLTDFPRTSTGKVNRNLLSNLVAER